MIIKVPLEITDDPLSRQACIQLSAKGINDELQLGGEVREGGLVDLECVNALPNLHRWPNLQV